MRPLEHNHPRIMLKLAKLAYSVYATAKITINIYIRHFSIADYIYANGCLHFINCNNLLLTNILLYICLFEEVVFKLCRIMKINSFSTIMYHTCLLFESSDNFNSHHLDLIRVISCRHPIPKEKTYVPVFKGR